MREQAKQLLYKHCKDTNVNDGKSLYYLAGQEESILDAIEEALKISSNLPVIGRFCECRLPDCKTKTVYICKECGKQQNC